MEVYGKSLIIIVFLLCLLVLVDYNFNFTGDKKEHFESVLSTVVTEMTPGMGDSSSLITLKGAGFDNVGMVLFDRKAECIILDERNDGEIKIMPPPLSELGKTIQDVREAMDPENPDAKGLEVSIQLVRKDKMNNIMGNSPGDTENIIDIPGLFFYYIDKIPYANNCPVVEPPQAEPDDIFIAEPAQVEYPPGSDLEFVNKILPNKLEELDKVIVKLEDKINEQENINTQEIEVLEALQAQRILNAYKQKINIHRYNIHEKIKNRNNKKNKNSVN